MDQRSLFFRSSFSAKYPGAEMWGKGFLFWNTKYVGDRNRLGLSHGVKVCGFFILAFAVWVLLGSVSNLFSAFCKFLGLMGSLIPAGVFAATLFAMKRMGSLVHLAEE